MSHERSTSQGTTEFHRNAWSTVLITDAWKDLTEDEMYRAWVRGLWQDLQPYTTGGVYVNYLEEERDEGRDRINAAYGTKYERLAKLKKKYDPENLFRSNQNIKPGGSDPE